MNETIVVSRIESSLQKSLRCFSTSADANNVPSLTHSGLGRSPEFVGIISGSGDSSGDSASPA